MFINKIFLIELKIHMLKIKKMRGMVSNLLINNLNPNNILDQIDIKDDINEIRLVYNDFSDYSKSITNYIDMVSLFNNIELNENVPYMQICEDKTNSMIYKLFKVEKDTLSQPIVKQFELKNWVSFEKNKKYRLLKNSIILKVFNK